MRGRSTSQCDEFNKYGVTRIPGMVPYTRMYIDESIPAVELSCLDMFQWTRTDAPLRHVQAAMHRPNTRRSIDPWSMLPSVIIEGDARTAASEAIAFAYLGLNPSDLICSESDLIARYSGCTRIPEAIFVDPSDATRMVSIEVKRIVGNRNPRDVRKTVRGRYVWPWIATIQSALSKANHVVVNDFNVKVHHMVFVLPNTISLKEARSIRRHVGRVMQECETAARVCCAHLIRVSEEVFDDLRAPVRRGR